MHECACFFLTMHVYTANVWTMTSSNRTNFPFKLAAIDIDQTLVGRDKKIGAENRRAIARLRELGCRVILASGRRHDNMLSFHRELGLEGFIVSTQGAVARHAFASQVLHAALIAPRDAAELVNEGLNRELTLMHWSRRGVVANQQSRWVRHYVEDCRDPVSICDLRGLADQPAEKIVWGADPALIASVLPTIRQRYGARFEITVTEDWFIEFTAPGATKAAGVAAVARHCQIGREHVLTFGDGNNDASMLAWAGCGVAMAHARPAAKAAARLVAPDGDPESSLARAIDLVIRTFATSDNEGQLHAAA